MLGLTVIIRNIIFKVSLKLRFNKSEQTNSQKRVILQLSSWAPCRFSFVKVEVTFDISLQLPCPPNRPYEPLKYFK